MTLISLKKPDATKQEKGKKMFSEEKTLQFREDDTLEDFSRDAKHSNGTLFTYCILWSLPVHWSYTGITNAKVD